MDGQRGFYEMENPAENPSKAAEYLQELNNIIETQQGLLEKQRVRIEELELQVTDLCTENARLKDQHQRHLATCRLQQGNHSSLGAIKENVLQEKSKCESWRGVRELLDKTSM
ncbi:IQ motif and SEC7 domain-containing protein 2 [Platichthys flesus]|uniref:IQ motif and SEC7 domain-containing protein 2 n=1 Tax=Platichthys flesus TaxID=8260 RepID=UPI002DB8AF52|nr:IQ motif and SEC7 domain-containing protein 2 [Platichthys flesus]